MTSLYYHSRGQIRGQDRLSMTVSMAQDIRSIWTTELFAARCAGAHEEATAIATRLDALDMAIRQATEDVDHDLFAQTIGGQL